MSKYKITKQDGTKIFYSHLWPKELIKLAAEKVLVQMTDDEINDCENKIYNELISKNKLLLTYDEFRECIKVGLNDYPMVCNSYLNTHTIDLAKYFDEICTQMNEIMISGDKSTGSIDSNLVSTKRSLMMDSIEKVVYKNFFLSDTERTAYEDGYIYIHDMGSRRDTINCCLFDMENVLRNGFEMGNIWYNEPVSLIEAFDTISSVVINSAAQIYGGFTIPQIDILLSYYAHKSLNTYLAKYTNFGINEIKSKEIAINDIRNDFMNGFKMLEYKFNTIVSPRGDYPFITITFGNSTDDFAKMASECAIRTRLKGQGKDGLRKPVLFPKLVFLFDHNLHTEGKPLYELFLEALDCSRQVMYPEFLSLTGKGYIPSIYKKYGKVISPMCCRAFLSPWYENGGMYPQDNNDQPIFVGRFNFGVVSLNLPMILAKSRKENLDFYSTLDYYLELIRNIHKTTYNFLAKKKAYTNPMCFTQGGLYKGNLDLNDTIEPLLKSATASFGFTALNELQRLYNDKSLVEDGEFALDVIKYINKKIKLFQEQDNILYTVYGTPAESLCGKQVIQFRNKYGIIKNVSDRDYVSNSFHCHVSENISAIEKQNFEFRFWDYTNGGKIQYIRFDYPKNRKALQSIVLHAMDLGLYEGINMSLSYCNKCGYNGDNIDICPRCKSKDITKIERMCGFLAYTRVHGETRLNKAKMAEIKDRKSM